MSEFRIKHIGIRSDSAAEAMQVAGLLAVLFDLTIRQTDTATWAGDLFEVMNSDKRNTARKAEPFCKIDSDKQRTDQSGSRGYGNSGNIRKRNAGLIQCIPDDLGNHFRMTAGGDFGNDAAEGTVPRDLRVDGV